MSNINLNPDERLAALLNTLSHSARRSEPTGQQASESSGDTISPQQRRALAQELTPYREAAQSLSAPAEVGSMRHYIETSPLSSEMRRSLPGLRAQVEAMTNAANQMRTLQEEVGPETELGQQIGVHLNALDNENFNSIPQRLSNLEGMSHPKKASELFGFNKISHIAEIDSYIETISNLESKIEKCNNERTRRSLSLMAEFMKTANQLIAKVSEINNAKRLTISENKMKEQEDLVSQLRESIENHNDLNRLFDRELIEYADRAKTASILGAFELNGKAYQDGQIVEQKAYIEIGKRFMKTIESQKIKISDKLDFDRFYELNIRLLKNTIDFLDKPDFEKYCMIEDIKSAIMPLSFQANDQKSIGRTIFERSRDTESHQRNVLMIQELMHHPNYLDTLTEELKEIVGNLQKDDIPTLSKSQKRRLKKAKNKQIEAENKQLSNLKKLADDDAEGVGSGGAMQDFRSNLPSPSDQSFEGIKKEREVQDHIEEVFKHLMSFAKILGFNVPIRNANGTLLTEIDASLNTCFIECTMLKRSNAKKEKQIERLATSDEVNPNRLPVILFAPKYSEESELEIDKIRKIPNSARIYVVRDENKLDELLVSMDEHLFSNMSLETKFVHGSLSTLNKNVEIDPKAKLDGIKSIEEAFQIVCDNPEEKAHKAASDWKNGKPRKLSDTLIANKTATMSITQDTRHVGGKAWPTGRWQMDIKMTRSGFTAQYSMFPTVYPHPNRISAFFAK